MKKGENPPQGRTPLISIIERGQAWTPQARHLPSMTAHQTADLNVGLRGCIICPESFIDVGRGWKIQTRDTWNVYINACSIVQIVAL